MVTGKVTPVTWKEGAKPRAAPIVIDAEVLFEIVSDSVLVSPTTTVPKSKVPLPTPTAPAPFAPPAKPWHPLSINTATASTREIAKWRY
jgi:hypothetical protein